MHLKSPITDSGHTLESHEACDLNSTGASTQTNRQNLWGGNGEGLFLSCPCDLLRSQVENHLAKPCFSSFNVHMDLLVILAPPWVKWSWRFQRGSWVGFFNSSAINGDAAPPRLVIINTQLNKAAPARSLTPNPLTTTQVLVVQMETVNLHSERLHYFLALESFPGLEKEAMSESVCIWKTMCTHI